MSGRSLCEKRVWSSNSSGGGGPPKLFLDPLFMLLTVKCCHCLALVFMVANIAHSLFIHSRDMKTVWHVHQTLLCADHPVLWRCGLQTNTLFVEEFVKGEGHWSYVKVDTKYVPHDLGERYDMSTTHVGDVIHPVL